MKRIAVVVSSLVACAAMASAQSFNLGLHGAYSTGGDVNESEFGGGAQVGAAINKYLSLELSGTMFTDGDSGVDLDVTSFALSARIGYPVSDPLLLYVGGGVHYTMFDASASSLDLLALTEPGVSGSDLAAENGLSVAEYEALLNEFGPHASIDVDNQFGGHVCVGGEFALTDRLSLFGEYRYTLSKLKGDISISMGGETVRESFKDDYNFGLVRAGLNFKL